MFGNELIMWALFAKIKDKLGVEFQDNEVRLDEYMILDDGHQWCHFKLV